MKNKKGFTLLELVVAMTIISVVITMVWGLMIFGNKVYNKESDDYDVQTSVRHAMDEISHLVSTSKAAFAVPDSSFLDDEWNYLALSGDQTRVVNYVWDNSSKSHVETTLVGPYKNVEFDITFFKDDPMNRDNTVKMSFVAKIHGVIKRFDILTGYESLNSLQIVDYGSAAHPAKALAYRTDNLNFSNLKVFVNIALILDTSGSMNDKDLPISKGSSTKVTRISGLKDSAVELVNQLNDNDNEDVVISASLIEFNTHANNPKPFLELSSNASTLKNQITALCRGGNSCEGGTNTGDGLRRAYYMLNDKTAAIEAERNDILEEYIIKNYVILLTDGVYTFYSDKMVKRGNNYYSTISYCARPGSFWQGCLETVQVRNYTMISDPLNGGYFIQDGDIEGITYYTGSTRLNNSTGRYELNLLHNQVRAVTTRGYSEFAGEDFVFGGVVRGYGNREDNRALAYIQRIADLGLSDVDEYTNYLIGFSPDVTVSVMDKIQNALNVHDTRRFHANDQQALGLAFTEIKTSIINDTWHYLGPRLIGD